MLLKPLRDYQEEAVRRALPHPGFFFFLEQRTGKTLCALALANKRKPRYLLIITIKKGVRVWNKEIKESLKIDWKCRVSVTYYQDLYKNRKMWRAWMRKHGHEAMVIVDEIHTIKKRGAKVGRVVRDLGKLARYRLGLTGTPISPRSNVKRKRLTVTAGLQDAWSQFDFIDSSIFGSYESFEKRHLIKGGFRGFQVIGYRNKKSFYKKLHKYSYRKLLSEVQEKKTKVKRTKVMFELEPRVRRVYDQLERQMYTYVNGRKITIPLIATRTVKLQQITGGFIKDTEENEILDLGLAKLQRLQQLLEKILRKDHGRKIVICAKFIRELDLIERLCSSMGLTHQVIKGGVEFDGSFNVQVTLIQIQSGVAIDLAAADDFIFYSLSHKHIDYEQAKFRILSYAKRQARYYYLLAKRTIDELVYEAATKKKDLTTLILDHYRRNQNDNRNRTPRRNGLLSLRTQRIGRR